MRMADADVLPYEFTDLADTMQKYRKELQKLLESKQEEAREREQELNEGAFSAAFDPRKPTLAPPREDMPPHLNFATLRNALDLLNKSAEHYKVMASRKRRPQDFPRAKQMASVSHKLLQSERSLTDPAEIPRRSWYKHLVCSSRRLHRIRAQNHAGYSRSHRATPLAGS